MSQSECRAISSVRRAWPDPSSCPTDRKSDAPLRRVAAPVSLRPSIVNEVRHEAFVACLPCLPGIPEASIEGRDFSGTHLMFLRGGGDPTSPDLLTARPQTYTPVQAYRSILRVDVRNQ
jgi:hypothetical protein